MLKKLWDWICLVMGVTPPGEKKPVDKWARLRAEREAWERDHREQTDLHHSAPDSQRKS